VAATGRARQVWPPDLRWGDGIVGPYHRISWRGPHEGTGGVLPFHPAGLPRSSVSGSIRASKRRVLVKTGSAMSLIVRDMYGLQCSECIGLTTRQRYLLSGKDLHRSVEVLVVDVQNR
jgi:hypothetical protein